MAMMMSSSSTLLLLLLLLLSVVASSSSSSSSSLQAKFYEKTCPLAEAVIRSTVQLEFIKNPGIAPGLLRLHFHDCFVEGCDASIMIEGKETEKMSPANVHLQGFEVVDAAKARLEELCPNVVSCADILAYAARDSVFLTGGPTWDVPAGRTDGRVSELSQPLKFLPPPTANVSLNSHFFNQLSLSQEDMIVLSGAHTIGASHCESFINRLYNFSSSSQVDPSMAPKFAKRLQRLCPPNPNPKTKTKVAMGLIFDNDYYANLKAGRGLFSSDQALFTDPTTRNAVIRLANGHGLTFRRKFAQSMIKMSSITGKSQGEIRKNCRLVNS